MSLDLVGLIFIVNNISLIIYYYHFHNYIILENSLRSFRLMEFTSRSGVGVAHLALRYAHRVYILFQYGNIFSLAHSHVNYNVKKNNLYSIRVLLEYISLRNILCFLSWTIDIIIYRSLLFGTNKSPWKCTRMHQMQFSPKTNLEEHDPRLP